MTHFQISLVATFVIAGAVWFGAGAAGVSQVWKVVLVLLSVGFGAFTSAMVGALSDVADAIRYHGDKTKTKA